MSKSERVMVCSLVAVFLGAAGASIISLIGSLLSVTHWITISLGGLFGAAVGLRMTAAIREIEKEAQP